MSLRTIQQEMEQEAKIDKAIDGIINCLLKYNENKRYHIVSSRKQSDAILVFNRYNLSTYSFVLNEENNAALNEYERDSRITMVYLKNKNTHDAKRATYGDIRNLLPAAKQNIKKLFFIYILKNFFTTPR